MHYDDPFDESVWLEAAKRRAELRLKQQAALRASGRAKLTAEIVQAVRAGHAAGMTTAALAQLYDLSINTIRRIVRRTLWATLD